MLRIQGADLRFALSAYRLIIELPQVLPAYWPVAGFTGMSSGAMTVHPGIAAIDSALHHVIIGSKTYIALLDLVRPAIVMCIV